MARLDDIARAAVDGDALRVRSEVQDWLSANPTLSDVARPDSEDVMILAVAASLIELLALRRGEPAPAWAAAIGPSPTPLFLLRSAATMPRLRALCEREAPEPLRRRRIFAPPDYLVAA